MGTPATDGLTDRSWRVLVAPDSFKESMTASQVCQAVADVFGGWGCEVTAVAMSDGGEGFVHAAHRALMSKGGLKANVTSRKGGERYDNDGDDSNDGADGGRIGCTRSSGIMEIAAPRSGDGTSFTFVALPGACGPLSEKRGSMCPKLVESYRELQGDEQMLDDTVYKWQQNAPELKRKGMLVDHESRTAFLEMASCSGLEWVAPGSRNPQRTTTYGCGQLLRAAMDPELDIQTIYVGLGGSATMDGGIGAIQALGIPVLVQPCGHDAPFVATRILNGGDLPDVVGLDFSRLQGGDTLLDRLLTGRVSIVLCTDVQNPLCGISGSAAVYGPQKGASDADIVVADEWLRRLVDVLASSIGPAGQATDVARRLRDGAGMGAAGGFPVAFCALREYAVKTKRGGECVSMVSGSEVLCRAVGMDALMNASDIVITGEGRYDSQTKEGKVVASISEHAARAGIPVVVLCGSHEPGQQGGDADRSSHLVVAMTHSIPFKKCMSDPTSSAIAALEDCKGQIMHVLHSDARMKG